MSTICWDLTPCSLVDFINDSGETDLHVQGIKVKVIYILKFEYARS
jgi:hypothetical protein